MFCTKITISCKSLSNDMYRVEVIAHERRFNFSSQSLVNGITAAIMVYHQATNGELAKWEEAFEGLYC